MRRHDLDLLRRAANHALDRQKRAVREQMEAVEALEAVLAGLDRETAAERVCSEHDARCTLLLPGYLQEQRVRRDRLGADLAAAQGELERRVQAAHELWLETRRYDEMLERMAKRERQETVRRENAFIDWLGEMRHASARRG